MGGASSWLLLMFVRMSVWWTGVRLFGAALLSFCSCCRPFSQHTTSCCKYPKNLNNLCFADRIVYSKDAYRISNSVDPDQTAPQTVSPDLSVRKQDQYGMYDQVAKRLGAILKTINHF